MINLYVNENKRWIKSKAKAIFRNYAFYRKSNRFSLSTYRSVKQNYDQLIDSITEEIKEYQSSYSPCLKESENPIMIRPDRFVSIVGDQMGRVFEYQGMIYRGIYKESFSDFKKVWDSGVLPVLATHHMIPEVYLTDYVTEEFSVVLGVEKVTIQENKVWSYAMYRDACILVLLLKILLNRFDLTLIDGHLNNVTFHRGNPLFVDIGSIIPYREIGVLTELVFAGIYHLVFGFIGNSMMYRLPTHDDDNINVFIFPRSYNLLAREYQDALRVLKRYYLLHGCFFQKHLVHKMFDLNEFEPQDIELLFPVKQEYSDNSFVTDWNEIAYYLQSFAPIDSLVTTNGTYGDAEKAFLEYKPDLKTISMDFMEHRLDLCYLNLKECRKNTNIVLYNYIYLLKRHADTVKSDMVLCMDPLNDSGTFWSIKDSVLANAICRLAEKYVVILFPLENETQYKLFFESEISQFASSCTVQRFEGQGVGLLLGTIRIAE